MMLAVRKAEPRDAEAAAMVLRRSITELCALDHHGDADTLAQWLANKSPRDILSWVEGEKKFYVVGEASGQIKGAGVLPRRGEGRVCSLSPRGQGQTLGKATLVLLEEKG